MRMNRGIRTKYLGPTNFKGARIKAQLDDGRSVTIPFPYEVSGSAERHHMAAWALLDKMEWVDKSRVELVGAEYGDHYYWSITYKD